MPTVPEPVNEVEAPETSAVVTAAPAASATVVFDAADVTFRDFIVPDVSARSTFSCGISTLAKLPDIVMSAARPIVTLLIPLPKSPFAVRFIFSIVALFVTEVLSTVVSPFA